MEHRPRVFNPQVASSWIEPMGMQLLLPLSSAAVIYWGCSCLMVLMCWVRGAKGADTQPPACKEGTAFPQPAVCSEVP